LDFFNPSFEHDLDRFRGDVDGIYCQPLFLKHKTVASNASTDVQNIPPT